MATVIKKSLQSNCMWNSGIEALAIADLKELQANRLRSLLNRLQNENSFHRRRLAEFGIKDSARLDLADLKNLPFMTKSDLHENYPFGLFCKPLTEVSRLHSSSGSKGKPAIVGYNSNDISIWSEVCARSLICAGVQAGDIIQNSYGYGLFTGGLGIHYGAELLKATVIPASGGMTRRQITLLQDLQAAILCCTPTYALNIACLLEELDIPLNTIKLRTGIFGAEPWTEELRKQLENKLSIEALDIYGLAEVIGPGVSMECSHSRVENGGLHVWEDHFLVEVIDPKSGNPLPEGEEGELVFTTLTKEAMPLLRYRTGDISRLERKPCQCGRSMVRMARVKARIDDMVIIRGVNFYPSSVEEILLSHPELSARYLLLIDRERALDTLCLQVELDQKVAKNWENACSAEDIAKHQEKLKGLIKNLLKDLLAITAEVELMPPGSLAITEGKAVRVIDRRN